MNTRGRRSGHPMNGLPGGGGARPLPLGTLSDLCNEASKPRLPRATEKGNA